MLDEWTGVVDQHLHTPLASPLGHLPSTLILSKVTQHDIRHPAGSVQLRRNLAGTHGIAAMHQHSTALIGQSPGHRRTDAPTTRRYQRPSPRKIKVHVPQARPRL